MTRPASQQPYLLYPENADLSRAFLQSGAFFGNHIHKKSNVILYFGKKGAVRMGIFRKRPLAFSVCAAAGLALAVMSAGSRLKLILLACFLFCGLLLSGLFRSSPSRNGAVHRRNSDLCRLRLPVGWIVGMVRPCFGSLSFPRRGNGRGGRVRHRAPVCGRERKPLHGSADRI